MPDEYIYLENIGGASEPSLASKDQKPTQSLIAHTQAVHTHKCVYTEFTKFIHTKFEYAHISLHTYTEPAYSHGHILNVYTHTHIESHKLYAHTHAVADTH